MVLRVIAILLALWAAERAAEACCLGGACTKYKQNGQGPQDVIEEPVYGYTHSVAGAIPRWSHARIAKFLSTGTWKPITPSSGPGNKLRPKLDPKMLVIPASSIQFMTADK